jgi:hypothetical protein
MTPKEHQKRGMNLFVIGLLGVVLCQFLGPVAWYLGSSYVRGCRFDGVEPNSYGQVGRVLGMVGTGLMFMQIFATLAIVALEVIIFMALM